MAIAVALGLRAGAAGSHFQATKRHGDSTTVRHQGRISQKGASWAFGPTSNGPGCDTASDSGDRHHRTEGELYVRVPKVPPDTKVIGRWAHAVRSLTVQSPGLKYRHGFAVQWSVWLPESCGLPGLRHESSSKA